VVVIKSRLEWKWWFTPGVEMVVHDWSGNEGSKFYFLNFIFVSLYRLDFNPVQVVYFPPKQKPQKQKQYINKNSNC